MTAFALLRRFWPYIAAASTILALAIALMLTRSTLAGVKGDLAAERAAHKLTISNVRAATATAKADDLANVVRVTGEQSSISKETTDDYTARIERLRADYAERLRTGKAAVGESGSGKPDMPVVPATASRTDEASCPAPVLPVKDALVCSEQAEQLIALQAWVKRQSEVAN